MSVIQTADITIPTNDAAIKRIRDCMNEISASLTRIEGEKIFIKEAIEALSKDVDLPKAYLRRMSKLYHSQNISEVAADQEAVVKLYEKVFDVAV